MKEAVPIWVTSGMEIDRRFLQLANARLPTLVTLGIETEVRLVQDANVLVPIEITLDGISKMTSEVVPRLLVLNAESPIFVTSTPPMNGGILTSEFVPV
jgi:hypothetical protein